MKIQTTRKMMKPKTTSSSHIARRRLMMRRVKKAVFRATLKKKHLKTQDPTDHEVEQGGVDGGLVTCSYGFFVDGEFVELTRGFLVNSGTVPYYLPVVDNNGFLLGQFSKLDDLSIAKDESPVADTSITFSDLLRSVCNL